MPADALARDVTAPVEPSPEMQQILIDVYRRDAEERRDLRAARRPGRGHAGVAVSARQDGGADHRRQAGDRRLRRRRLPAHDHRRAAVSGPVGDPVAVCRVAVLAEPACHSLSRFRVADAAAADRPLASGLARRGLRGAAAGVARCRRRWWTTNGSAPRPRPTRCAPACGRLLGDPAGRHRARSEHARAGVRLLLGAGTLRRSAGRRARHHRRRVPHDPAAARSTGRSGRRGGQGRRAAGRHASPSAWPRPWTIAPRACWCRRCLFETAEIVPHLDAVARRVRAARRDAAGRCLPSLNVVPFDDRQRWAWTTRSSPAAATSTASSARATASCACRRDCELRPVITGWFSEFDELAEDSRLPRRAIERYGATARRRPVRRRDLRSDVALPRGRGVRVPSAHGTDADRLREISRHQVGCCARRIEALDLAARGGHRRADAAGTPRRLSRHPLRATPHDWSRGCAPASVFADSRGDVLRLGPAPYVADRAVDRGYRHPAPGHQALRRPRQPPGWRPTSCPSRGPSNPTV